MSANKDILQKLVGCELAGVTFIRDYLQLLFDGPYMNIYSWPTVLVSSEKIDMKKNGYRDALCDQIGKTVSKAIEVPEKNLTLHFSDSSEIVISLKAGKQREAEAALLQLSDKDWAVWRGGA